MPEDPADLPLIAYHGEMLTARRLRKATGCWHCREPLAKGEVAYGVFGNSMNRMQRMHLGCVGLAIMAGLAKPLVSGHSARDTNREQSTKVQTRAGRSANSGSSLT